MKRRRNTALFALFLLFWAFLAFYGTEKAVGDYAATVLKNAVYTRVNSRIYDFSAENVGLFRNIARYDRNAAGRLSAISIDAAAVNSIRLGLEREIAGEIDKLQCETFRMPVGNIFGVKLLSSSGPGIKIKIVPLGTVKCGTVNKFESAGINHTLHRLGLKFTVSFGGAPPFSGGVFQTDFYVSLCENIIVGEVPRVYFK